MAHATLIPSIVPDWATPGEKRVYRLPRDQLPEDHIAWQELTVSHRGRSQHPDFVIMGPDVGSIVLEVKDWVLDNITEVRRTLFVVRTRAMKKHDPFQQARDGAVAINNLLQSSNDPRLVH